jgi:hypothetical protein|tara:strand:- start:295 stop:675 length:381 start_codon:yes stop_codon:yes gene_type:complete
MNPLLLNCADSQLQEYINHNLKIKEQIIENMLNDQESECSICLERYITGKKYICMPFKCQHDICFDCFTKLCNATTKYIEDNTSKDILCPLCREKPNKYWKTSDRIKFYRYEFLCSGTIYLSLPDI